MTATLDDEVADLRRANAELQRRLDEALAHESATAEVLGVINSSPGLQPVFDAMLDKAVRLCGGTFGMLALYDGDGYRGVAAHDAAASFPDILSHIHRAVPGTTLDGLEVSLRTVQLPDVAAEPAYDPVRALNPAYARVRSHLCVPMVKENSLLGAILIYRDEVLPFTDKQVELVENFAAQAVIAMENARLITETREALEQQTATAEVLGVINSSPGDLAPVFDAILEKAHRLCGIATGSLQLYDGQKFRAVAVHGMSQAMEEVLRQGYIPLEMPNHRLLQGERSVHIPDMAQIDHPVARAVVEDGYRTLVCVALRNDDRLLGQIVGAWPEIRTVVDKELALLENFAAQAVIAMENARLLTELQQRTGDLQESLDYQTATSDVLKVISQSGAELVPVLNTLVETASRICNAEMAFIFRREGNLYRLAASVGFSAETRALVEANPILAGRGTIAGRTALTGVVVHIPDVRIDPEYTWGEFIRVAKTPTMLGVPLLHDDGPIGVIVLARQRVEPFTEKEIELVRTFADQAVIAIENARLITETREALDQQTATAKVLGVINSSPGDLTPVFDAILEKAHSLCGAAKGVLVTYDGEYFRSVATRGVSEKYATMSRASQHNSRGSPPQRLLDGERVVEVPDIGALPFPMTRAAAEHEGARTVLYVPLRKDEALLGYLTAFRQEVRPFSDKQIALLENFAAQAVIAMENARLITETREALEQQTATAEILRVISGSATDLQPVFEAIVERTIKLCDAEFTAVARYEDDGLLHLVATNNLSSEGAAAFHSLFPRQPTRGFFMGRAFLAGQPINVADVLADPDYDERTQEVLQSLTEYRSFLAVPIIRDGRAIGVIGCARREVRPFTPTQIELVSTFADQAVIAIENARLLDEIRQRQQELRVTFDNMADGVVMFDEDLRLAAWNRNFQELLDLPDAVLADRPSYADYLRVLAERGEFGSDDIAAELSRRLERTDQEFRMERTRPDGRVIEVRRNAVPDGGFVLIYSDITERKRSEAEIRAARDAAETALRDLRAAQANLIQAEKMASLGQLTAGIAHEIKNPLNFVNNFADLSGELLKELQDSAAPGWAALDGDKRAEIDETMVMLTGNLEKIAEHGKRADNIVKSMLEHSRGVSGERREVDLNGLVEEALNLAYHGARAQDQTFNITMERDFDPALRPMGLAPQEITRVFLNLFGNGFYAANKRAHGNGDPTFHPTLTVSTRDLGDVVEVKVRDNGTGIPAEIRDKLFQPFFTTKPTGEGTGLGLSISYDIVTQQHGGTITVESEPGEFTEFIVRLPRGGTPSTNGAQIEP